MQLTGGSHTQEELVSTPVRTGGSPTQEELVSTPVRTGGSPNQEELVSTPVRIVHAASPPRRAASTRSREPRAAAADGAQQLPVVAPGARGNARARAGGEHPRAPVPDLGVNRVYITHQNGRVEGAPAQRVSVSCAFLQYVTEIALQARFQLISSKRNKTDVKVPIVV